MSLKDRLVDKSFSYNNAFLKRLGNNWQNKAIAKDGSVIMNKDKWNPKEGMPIVLKTRLSKDYGEIKDIVAGIAADRIQKVVRKALKATLLEAVPFKGEATKKSYFVYKKRLTQMANFNTWNVGYATGDTAKQLSEGATRNLKSIYKENEKTIDVRYKIPPEVSMKLASGSKLTTIKGGRGLADSLKKWIKAKGFYKGKNTRDVAWAIVRSWQKIGKPAIANEKALSISSNPELREKFNYYLRSYMNS
jgi:hypothetical protein